MKKTEKNASTETGRSAEAFAELYLLQKGHLILQKNFHYSTIAEIDLVSKDQNTLVFTEVKSRKPWKNAHPEKAVHSLKQRKITQAARHYLRKFPHPDEIRFDVISIITHPEKAWELEHFEHAFVPVEYY
jgi:putative endonuclease